MVKQYIRDKRSPVPKNEQVSKVMSANKAKHTKPELLLRKALWANGLKGYRNNYKKVPGRPDIAFPVKKVAIFVNGCFWHRCPHYNYQLPKTNTAFWEIKFKKNKDRDALKTAQLEALGWKVITVWECVVDEDMNRIITQLKKMLK
jgi:DNA mismatch endonuclease (patch repair protein)